VSRAHRLTCLTALLTALISGCVSQPPAPPAPQVQVPGNVQALNALLAEHWEWTLRDSPEFATILGDPRYNDRWSDITLAGAERQRNELEAFLVRFEGIDAAGMSEQDRLNRELMIRQLRDGMRGIDHRLHLMPIDQFAGLHIQLPQFAAIVPTASVKDYEDYLARLQKVPALLKDLEAVLRQGVAEKLMPPRTLLEKTVKQCESVAKPAGADSPFAQPLLKFPDTIAPAERERLRAAIVAAIDTQVRPAYRTLGKFIARHYAPHGRTKSGVWALPNGDALYRFAIEQRTTTSRSPEEIHQLGLEEVARIEAEQTKIATQLGYKDLRALRKALAKDPKVRATSRQQILDLYRTYTDRMEERLPQLFGLLPKSRVEIHAVEEFREKEASGAQYNRGTPDGRRPGRVYVNTGDFTTRPLFDIETTAYHEGVPGHHMQISIAQTLPGLPPFRQNAIYTAYVEGWALYSERLGREVGFLQEPLNYYGHLDAELLRANRLVLDTGVHYKRWTRQQMVDWFRAHSAQPEVDIQAETDRYIVWPAQALAYKLGQLKILELRERAKARLGARFDIRAFHDHILSGGALPLEVLETRFNDWLATQGA
jgi:uncharacterized protein (DUF885 family)